jgi:hypothetical protein
MLTAMDEKRPMMTLRPVKAEYAVPMYVECISYFPVTNGPPPLVTITAQRKRARKVGGTMTALTRKRIRSFSIGMRARQVWQIQYRKMQSRPAAER